MDHVIQLHQDVRPNDVLDVHRLLRREDHCATIMGGLKFDTLLQTQSGRERKWEAEGRWEREEVGERGGGRERRWERQEVGERGGGRDRRWVREEVGERGERERRWE